MSDLVKKFFREDLTEAEDKALSESLLSSDEAAEEFVKISEEAYTRYGLPKADWEGPIPHTLLKPHGGSPWFGATMVVLGLTAGIVYWICHRQVTSTQEISSPASTVKPPAAVPVNKPARHESFPINRIQKVISETGTTLPKAVPEALKSPLAAVKKTVSNAVPNLSQGIPAASEIRPAPSVPSLPGQQAIASTAGSPVRSSTTPVHWDQANSQNYSSLSVVVQQTRPSAIEVNVLDSHGTLIDLLYRGSLGIGDWIFQWNGKLADGSPAQAGYYQIEVKVGAYSQRKTIQIH